MREAEGVVEIIPNPQWFRWAESDEREAKATGEPPENLVYDLEKTKRQRDGLAGEPAKSPQGSQVDTVSIKNSETDKALAAARSHGRTPSARMWRGNSSRIGNSDNIGVVS